MMKNRPQHKWTGEQEQFLKDNIVGTPYAKMTDKLNNKFGLDLSIHQVKARLQSLGLKNGIDGTFRKGNIPQNKGKKQIEFMSPEAIERTKATRFKKGDRPQNYKPIGFERIDKRDGYVLVKVRDDGTWPERWRLKHYVEWEKVNGPVPEDKRFIFLDGDRANCSMDNLKLVDYSVGAIMNKQGLHTYGSQDLQEIGINTAKLIQVIGDKSNKSNT